MSLKLEKKGYTEEKLDCPNCGSSITLYLDDRGVVRKVPIWAELLKDNKIKCYCESVLSYQSE